MDGVRQRERPPVAQSLRKSRLARCAFVSLTARLVARVRRWAVLGDPFADRHLRVIRSVTWLSAIAQAHGDIMVVQACGQELSHPRFLVHATSRTVPRHTLDELCV
jgi:hypothetical protein